MKNPWETGIDGYDINASYDMGAKMVENYCLYTFLYAKAANGEFQISKTGSIAWTAENQSGTTMT